MEVGVVTQFVRESSVATAKDNQDAAESDVDNGFRVGEMGAKDQCAPTKRRLIFVLNLR